MVISPNVIEITFIKLLHPIFWKLHNLSDWKPYTKGRLTMFNNNAMFIIFINNNIEWGNHHQTHRVSRYTSPYSPTWEDLISITLQQLSRRKTWPAAGATRCHRGAVFRSSAGTQKPVSSRPSAICVCACYVLVKNKFWTSGTGLNAVGLWWHECWFKVWFC